VVNCLTYGSIWSFEWVQDQSQPRVDCHRCNKRYWFVSWCISGDRVVLSVSVEIQIGSPDSSSGNYHRYCGCCSIIWVDGCFLLDSHRCLVCCHHSRCCRSCCIAGSSTIFYFFTFQIFLILHKVYSFWRVSPLEFVVWLAAVLVTIFSTIENGIYTSIASSAALLLVRIAHPRGYFLGKVTIHEDSPHNKESRDVFIPLARDGITAPHLKIIPPSPGVIIYRFEESYLYPNSSLINSALVDYVKQNMRRGKDMANVKLSDRPWNDPGPRSHDAERTENESRPVLHAIVLDFSAV
jgi:hypothetical protein